MIAASPWALRPRCHVNIGVQKAVLCVPARLPGRTRRSLVTARNDQSGNGGTSGGESPLSSVSDAVIGFFDDITRGSVSIDEDDAPEELKVAAAAADAAVAAMPPLASEAAAAAAATADAAARAAAEAAGVSEAVGEWEGAAISAVAAAAAATSSGDGSTAAKSLETYAAVVHQDLSIAGSSSSSSSGHGSTASKLQAQPGGIAGSSGSGNGSSSTSSKSRQAVTAEAVAGAGGELQASTLSLSAAAEDGAVAAGQVAAWVLKGVVGVGLLQAFKTGVEAAMQQFGITNFPPAVASMLAVPLLLSAVGSQTADSMVQLYDSCIAPWTTDILGLFYVPAVAILPVLLRGMQGPDLAGLLSVAVLSAAATLVLTAKAAAAWTPAQPATPAPAAAAAGGYRLTSGPAAPVLLSLSFLAAAGPLALTRFDPVNFGAQMALPVGFAWSLMGFVAARVYLQQQQKKGGKPGWPSPVLAGAVAAKLGVAWHASIMGWGYRDALSLYYVGDVLGAGDVLAAPLGAALTAVGFLIHKHRAALALPAIAATAALSAAFSVTTSVAAAKVLGVSTDWARAFIPRSVTDSTASHFARAIGAPSECTGLVVILQAAVTILMGRLILKAVNGGKTGPAAAGTAVGSTAGLIGVAGVCGSNEVALANGAVAYAVMVAIASLLSSVPAITAVLAALVA